MDLSNFDDFLASLDVELFDFEQPSLTEDLVGLIAEFSCGQRLTALELCWWVQVRELYFALLNLEHGALCVSVGGPSKSVAFQLGLSELTVLHSWWFDRVWFTLDAMELRSDNETFKACADVAMQDSCTIARYLPGYVSIMPCEYHIFNTLKRVKGNRAKYVHDWFSNCSLKRLFMLTLKAHLYQRILFGKTVLADKGDAIDELYDIFNELITVQLSMFNYFLEPVVPIFYKTIDGLNVVLELISNLVQFKTILNVLIFCWTIWIIWKALVKITMPVIWVMSLLSQSFKLLIKGYSMKSEINNGNNDENYYMNTEVTEKGLVHAVKVNGIVYYLQSKDKNLRVEETALPGSMLAASSSKPVGAIMVANQDTELSLLGCFWRYYDDLVTAKHVANLAFNGLAEVYLVGYETNQRGSVILNLKNVHRVSNDLFNIDNNKFSCETLDVFVRALAPSLWAKLKVQKASVKKNSLFNQTVNSVGWVNGVLMTGGGKILQSKQCLEIQHDASTHKGFSGSPLFSGSSVVGMHIAGLETYNIAIRIEAIIHFLPELESNNPDEQEYKDGFKHLGEDYEVHSEHGEFVGRNNQGKIKFLTEEELLARGLDITDKVRSRDLVNFIPKSGKLWADDDDDNYVITRRRLECADVEQQTVADKYYQRMDDMLAVHCGKVPTVNTAVHNYFESRMGDLTEIGYVKGEQSWPVINPQTEEVSLQKHLDLFGKRNADLTHPPNQTEINRCVELVLMLLAHNTFEPRVGYKDPDNIERIIHSNLVNEKKSAGVPYQGEGMATNKDVLNKLGVQGLIERVFKEWNKEFYYKVFVKAEPTKKRKLDGGMPRIITGLPLHKMVKHQALFREMLEICVLNWKLSPMKYAFSPGKPGHPEHLADVFDGFDVYECDKNNWDFNMFKYFFDIVAKIVPRLAAQPSGMSDDEFNQFRIDAYESIIEVMEKGIYCCTNGNTYISKFKGIMKSGWLLTIFINTLCQIVFDILVKIRMGLSNDEILSAIYCLIAGGDDTLQTFPKDFNIDNYISESKKLGLDVTFKKHKEFSGCEYFSTEFWKCRNGVIKYKPVRITKHLEKMMRVKHDDLAMALSSAMINYCWDNKRFNFFAKMYSHFRTENPNNFPLNLKKDQQLLQFMSKGLEMKLDFDVETVRDFLDNYFPEC